MGFSFNLGKHFVGSEGRSYLFDNPCRPYQHAQMAMRRAIRMGQARHSVP
jgi:hypothetical protein